MNEIEIFVVIIILLMGVPDLCEKLGRPSLAYIIYLTAGFIIGPMMTVKAQNLLIDVGNFGFILLLFGIGLEIELPKIKDLALAARKALKWTLLQYPVVFTLALVADLSYSEAFLATVAVSACSLGMAYPALQQMTEISQERKEALLFIMTILEIQAVIILSGGQAFSSHGFGIRFIFQLIGIVVAVMLVGLLANHLTRFLEILIEKTIRWKAQIVVLFVLIIAGTGERLGLSSPKTAFYLGLFINRATGEGLGLQKHLAPVGSRLLIPAFMVGLGARIPLELAFSKAGFLALCSAVFLLAYRQKTQHMLLPAEGQSRAFLLLSPNLTMIALALQTLEQNSTNESSLIWLAFMGLFITLFSILGLPKANTQFDDQAYGSPVKSGPP